MFIFRKFFYAGFLVIGLILGYRAHDYTAQHACDQDSGTWRADRGYCER